MEDCIFCKIIKGEIPSNTLFEDDICKVIMDANPGSNGHILILPKKHFEDFLEMDKETLGHMHDVAKRVKEMQYNSLSPDGLVLLVNYGVTQKVKHYHLHLIPVYNEKQELLNVDEVYNKIMKN